MKTSELEGDECMTTSTYVKLAQELDPAGSKCSFCGKDNDFADDIGWFYIHPTDTSHGHCCKACFDGEPGRKHIKRYGLGER